MTEYTCYASCAFGIEGILAGELRQLGFGHVDAQDARVYFQADETGIARANVFLRTADRIYMVLKEFEATTFEQLFEEIRSIDFPSILPSDARIPVDANAVRSELMSVSDIQAISKKAVIGALQRAYHMDRFPENGNLFHVFVNIYKDKVTVALNTSGAGLNRRGYRLKNVQAPLKETLAAAMVLISRWTHRSFFDPMCGSGTIAIEAAMLAANMAPGIKRKFDAANYSNDFRKAFQDSREEARQLLAVPRMMISASDIDAKSVRLAKEHAHNMDVGDYIGFNVADALRMGQPENPSVIITNPPYAVRIGGEREVESLYKRMGRLFLGFQDTLSFILSPNDRFESLYGKKADKKRKLYNGNLKCTYYQYFRKR